MSTDNAEEADKGCLLKWAYILKVCMVHRAGENAG